MDLEQIRQAARLRSQTAANPPNEEQKHIEQDEDAVVNNEDFCFRCKRRGEIFCCDNCYRSFHAENGCMTSRPTENIWSCPCCKLRQECPVCDAPILPTDDSHICSLCCRKTHYPCTGVPKPLLKALPKQLTFASECYFICYVCLYNSEIKHVVKTETSEFGQYNLVTPYFASSAHLGWISDLNIKNIAGKQKKLKHNTSASQVFTPSIMERVIAVKPPITYMNAPTDELIRLLRDPTRRVEQGHPENFKFLVKWRDSDYQHSTWQDEFLVKQSPCNSLEVFIRRKEFELYYLIEKSAQLRDFRPIPTNVPELQPREAKLVDEMMDMYHKKHRILLNKWKSERSCQTVVGAFLSQLFYKVMVERPILVLAKHREFSIWLKLLEEFCPGMYVVNLTGLHDSRNIIKMRELYFEQAGVPKFDVMLTSFECLGKDNSMFYNKEIMVNWSTIVYDDEARCEAFITGRPNSEEAFRIVLTSKLICYFVGQYGYEDVKQILQVMGTQGRPFPALLENENLIRFVKEWIPSTFTEWPEFQPDLKFKPKPASSRLKWMDKDMDMDEQLPKKTETSPKFPTMATLQNDSKKKNVSEEVEVAPPVKPVKVPLPRGRRPKVRDPPPTAPVANPIVAPIDKDLPWHRFKRMAFLRFVLSFGMDYGSLANLAEQLELFDKDAFENNPTTIEELKRYIRTFGKLLQGQSQEYHKKMMFQLEPTAILRRIIDLKNLRKAFFKFSPTPDKFPFKSPFETIGCTTSTLLPQKYWKEKDDLLLIQLILRHGYDNWAEIAQSKQWKSDRYPSLQPSATILAKIGLQDTIEQSRVCVRNISSRASSIVQYLRLANVNLE